MIKEFKYFFYLATIVGFIFFIGNYYFSDSNKKKSYRSVKFYDDKIIEYSINLKILDSNTDNITEYIGNNLNKNKKKYKFWELLTDNDK